MTILAIILGVLFLGTLGLLLAVSRAFCDAQARAEHAEEQVAQLSQIALRQATLAHRPAGWYGMHES